MQLTFEQVTYSYGSSSSPREATPALSGVSFSVADGEFLGIIGHTGSGKSTLIQHINALLLPTSGKVTVDGVDTAADRASRRAIRAKVGVVFQYPEYQLFGNTVREDVAFGPKNRGLSSVEVDARVERAITRVGLDPADCLDKSPFDFSGGQRRRIALAGVLACEPHILVLDEPMAGLDPRGRHEILGYLKNLHDEGMTVIMVSHSMEDVSEMADRVLVMNGGKVFTEGTPEEVFTHAVELREIGLGVPIETSFARQLADEGGFTFDQTTFTVPQLADAIAAQLGVSAGQEGGAVHV